jgi:uncharacterized protein (DUF58 family)
VSATAKLHGYAAFGAACLVLAVAMRRGELVAVAAPFLLVVAVAVARPRPLGTVQATARVEGDRDRAVEGDTLVVTVEVTGMGGVPRLDLNVPVMPGLHIEDGDTKSAGREGTVTWRVACDRFGAHRIGAVRMRAHDALSLLTRDSEVRIDRMVRVYPHPERIAAALRPLHTQARAGNQRSPLLGSGIEFAGIRPFVPGDRPRQVNWRMSTRRQMLHVNDFHPERNADVVLLLDTFADVRAAQAARSCAERTGAEGAEGGVAAMGPPGAGSARPVGAAQAARKNSPRSTLALGVHAVAGMAAHFLQARDRVGVAGYGGMVRWLLPGMGALQQQRILDALLDTEVSLHYAWKGIDLLPPRLLPPRALVVVVSPLVDERMHTVIADLRGRHHDVAVLEISPLPFTTPGDGPLDALTHRIWVLQRAAIRQRLLRQGIAVAEWREEWPLTRPLEEMARFRRFATTGRS